VYALKLLWGVFNKQGQLVNAFYCDEDAGFYDVNDEEVALETDQYIRILHPYYLSPEQRTQWNDKVYALELVTEFQILDRKVYTVNPAEKDLAYTHQFNKQKVPKGADYVNTFLVKRQWLKSGSDGGSIEFTKLYQEGAYTAHANIMGPAVVYQEGKAEAEVFEVNFYGKHWRNKVCLKDVPPLFYSEVMYDIELLLEP